MKIIAFGEQVPQYHRLKSSHKTIHHRISQKLRSAISMLKTPAEIWHRGGQFFPWAQRHERQHFGPSCRIQDLFQRWDQIYLDLQSTRLQFISPPPFFHHDLLHAAVRVGHIEVRTGYNFKNKLLCIEALKRTGKASPLFYKGASVVLDRNNRLALLGDRVLSLALCEIWFHSGHSTGNYNVMNKLTETRAALNITGRAMKLHQDILLHSSTPESSNDQVAETFEAIIGAIYVDSDHSVPTVKEVLNNLGLDNHEFLQTVDSQVALARSEKELKEDTVRDKSYTRNPQSNQAALRFPKGKPESAMEHDESRAEESLEPSIGFSHTAEGLKK